MPLVRRNQLWTQLLQFHYILSVASLFLLVILYIMPMMPLLVITFSYLTLAPYIWQFSPQEGELCHYTLQLLLFLISQISNVLLVCMPKRIISFKLLVIPKFTTVWCSFPSSVLLLLLTFIPILSTPCYPLHSQLI